MEAVDTRSKHGLQRLDKVLGIHGVSAANRRTLFKKKKGKRETQLAAGSFITLLWQTHAHTGLLLVEGCALLFAWQVQFSSNRPTPAASSLLCLSSPPPITDLPSSCVSRPGNHCASFNRHSIFVFAVLFFLRRGRGRLQSFWLFFFFIKMSEITLQVDCHDEAA